MSLRAFARKILIRGSLKIRKLSASRLKSVALGITVLPMASSSGGISGTSIFNSLWNSLMKYLFQPILSAFSSAFSGVMSGMVGGLDIMFQSWGFSLASYGIWGPLMVVISISVALFVGYLIFDAIGIEKDVLGGEEAL
jgi:hypothetical protein